LSSVAGYSGIIHYRSHALDGLMPAMSDKLANAVFWFFNYQLNTIESVCHKAICQLEQVLVQNEESSIGYAVLGHLYGASMVYNYPYGSNPMSMAQQYVRQALILNPKCQQAYITLGWLHLLEGRKEETIENSEKGYAINPNSSFCKCDLSLCMTLLGEYKKSEQYLEKALKINPLPYWWLNIPTTMIAMKARNFEKMLFSAQSMERLPMVFDSVFEIVALY